MVQLDERYCSKYMYMHITFLHDIFLFSELPKADCTDGDVRLIQREDAFTGVFQLCRGGVWGTVCISSVVSNFFAADIACRQLGFGFGEYHFT